MRWTVEGFNVLLQLPLVKYAVRAYYESFPQGEKTKYYFRPKEEGYPDSGINDMRVIVLPNGEVETAYPLSGPAVKRWVPELNDGDGDFVDTA